MSYHGRFEPQNQPKKKRGLRIFLIILAIILVIAVGAVAAGAIYYYRMVNKMNIIEKRKKEQFDDVFYEFIDNSTFEMNEKVWNAVKRAGSSVTISCRSVSRTAVKPSPVSR